MVFIINVVQESIIGSCVVLSYQRIVQEVPACTCSVHHQHRRSRIQRKLFGFRSLPGLPEACIVLLSVGESFLVRAKIHRSDFQSLFCSRPSRDRNLPSRPVSFGTQSIRHRLFFGHSTHQRLQHHQGRQCRHHWFENRLHRPQHNFCKLENTNAVIAFQSLITLMQYERHVT